VTGGAGFIGSHVVDALLARGDEVHVLDDLSKGTRANVPEGAQLHESDIRGDAGGVFDAARPEVCFHLAAQADVRVSVERPDFDAEVNVLGTLQVLEAAQRHGTKVVFSSTGGSIYGEWDGPAAGHQGGVLNVGTGVETSVLDLYARVQRAAGLEREPQFADARAGELQRSVLDASRARRELGWAPQRSLDEGLAATWAWISSR